MDTNGYYESSHRNNKPRAEIGQIQNTCMRPVTLKGMNNIRRAGVSSGCGKRTAYPNPDSGVFQVQRQVHVRNVRPRISANFANTGDGNGVRVIQALQNPSTSSVFLHTEDFNRANSSSSNHCKRTHEDIQATSPTCDMGIARNVHRCGVTVGTTSTGRGVGYSCVVTRNNGEGSSFVHNEAYVKEMVDIILQVLRPMYINDDDQIRSSTARIFGIVSKVLINQKEILKQIPVLLTIPITKEGLRIQTTVAKSMLELVNIYDPKYALRLCLKEKRMCVCVHIYSMMFMHEEAIALALQVHLELAMAEADKVEDDEALRKKLWLMVAKHVLEQEKGTERENIRKAIAFLKETDGLLKIEDILTLFPDFALIDDFKAAHILDLQKQLTLMSVEPKVGVNGGSGGDDSITSVAPVDKIRSQLDDAIASECPFCGDLIINEISKPFILPEESYLASSWEIMSKNVGSKTGISFVV
ncbi:hypothetical protein Tco_0808193 [Tanacetum coccineum]